MDDGWDLRAVVRSCTASTIVSSVVATAENTPAVVDLHEHGLYRLETRGNESNLVSYPNFGETLNNISCGLVEVHKDGCHQPLLNIASAATTTATSISFDRGRFVHEQPSKLGDSISFSIQPVDSQPIHARKRENKKRVVELREEEWRNDGWAWRKYGQKPIKGSPYPRNYYRCSTSQDCLAKKQVERSLTVTSNLIVSYSGDHLHPRPTYLSSLAGTTRSTKFSTVATALPQQPPCSSSSPPSATSFSPTTSLKEDETEMNDDDIDQLIKNY